MCAALFTLTNAISGLTNGCNTRPTVVNAIHHHMPTWQHSAHYRSAVTYSLSSNDGFCLYLLQVCCFGTFGIDIYITGAHFVPVFLFVHPPHVSICLSREWAVSSRCSFGTDLITYLFSLSYSKLLSLRVLLRADIFLPPLLLSAFHPASPSAPHQLTPTWPDTACTLSMYFLFPRFLGI